MIEEKSFIGKNITKFNKGFYKQDFIPVLYNVFFKIKAKERVSFLFSDEKEKETFINILSGKDSNYYGFFEFENDIFFSNSKNNISSIVHFNDIDEFLNQNHQHSSFAFLQDKETFKKFSTINNYIFKNHNNKILIYKNHFLYSFKKNELELNKRIYDQIKKLIKDMNHYIKKIENESEYQFKLNLINKVYEIYESYIINQMNLLYYVNKKLIRHFVTKIKTENETTNKNYLEYKQNKFNWNVINFLHKQKIKYFSFLKQTKTIKNIKYKNIMKLRTKQNEFLFFQKKYKNSFLKEKNNKFLYRYNINKFCNKFIKNNMNKFYYLNNKQIEQLITDINLQYSLLLIDDNLTIENNKFKNKISSFLNHSAEMKKNMNNNFKIDTNYYHTNSKTNYKEILAKEKENKIMELSTEQNEIENVNTKWKELEKQDNYDEFKWFKTNFIAALNEEIKKLNIEIDKQLKENHNLKKELHQIIIRFALLQKKILKKTRSNNLIKNSNSFEKIDNKYSKIYKNLQNDFKQIETFWSEKITFINKNKYLFFLYKYHIYKISDFCEFNFFDLHKNINELSNLKKTLLLFVKFLLSNKPINVFNFNFSSLSNDEKKQFDQIYNNIVASKEKFWIQISDEFQNTNADADWLNIIRNSRNIEFGTIDELLKFPFYDYTSQLLNKINTINLEETQKIDTYKYDFYKINNNHYVYGNINEIYKKNKKVPKISSLTVMPFKVEEFQNNVKFAKSLKKLENNKIKVDNFVKQEESIIIDVTKEFKI